MASDSSIPIFRLPVEILEEIIEITPTLTQISLCQVSKLFHSLAIRPVYHEITLSTPSAVVACCRTLVANRSTAVAVKSFTISYTPLDTLGALYLSSFYAIIRKALQSLSSVNQLKLLVHDTHYVASLKYCTFPRLRQFECYFPLTVPLTSFLNRHPTISYLQIAPHEDFDSSRISVLPIVNLPKLEYFVGNSEFVTALVCQTSLRAAFVFWDVIDEEPQDAIAALGRSSGDTLNVVSCRRRGWNLDLLDLISSQLPHIYVLSITNLLVVDSHPSEAALDTIKGYLSRFTRLQRLLIHCVDYWSMSDVETRMDHDFTTVTAWGQVCPSLTECTLPHSNGLKWIRIMEDLWLPDPGELQGTRWLWKMLCTKRYPQWNRVLDTMEERVRERAPNPREFEGTIANLRALISKKYWASGEEGGVQRYGGGDSENNVDDYDAI